ncbi:MAG TPA: HDOD domain-containing protein [Bryobacteraceae bacterium]|nr:HDOD domain-containing protein [Bryobacteraceae bacterium]
MVESEAKYGELERLPQFPSIATKLMRVLANDGASIRKIADLVRVDSALSVELLRLVNSPLFGLPAHIGSIQQALTLLGFEAVKRHVLAASMRMYFRSAVRLDLLRGIWRHSVACALICEELSVACSSAQNADDRIYTAGLLHDIGRLGLFVSHPQTYAELLEQGGASLREREIHAFGFDHCEAGGWLASHWGLPLEIQMGAAGHHDTPTSPVEGVADMVRVGVLLADCFGFDVLPPEHSYTLSEIRTLLPHSAQYRFDPDEKTFKARITDKLNAFD